MAKDWFTTHVPSYVREGSIFKFEVILGTKDNKQKIEVDIPDGLHIDEINIREDLAEVPAQFAFWTSIYSEMKQQCALVERTIKAKRGQVIEKALKEAAAENMRLTDKQTQAIVDNDPDIKKLDAKLLSLQKDTGKIYFMIEAMRIKSDNLRSLAGFVRIETSNSKSSHST